MITIINGRMKKEEFRSSQGCRYFGIFLLLFPMLMSGCMSFPTNLTSPIETSLVLRIQDFPYGWEDSPFKSEEIPDALNSFYLAFLHKSSPNWINFIYHLTIYENTEMAWNSIPYWEARLFPTDAWTLSKELMFETIRSEDYLGIGFMDILIDDEPIKTYRIIQVHDNRVVYLSANLDGEVITEDFLLAVLERVDERIQGGAPIELDPIVVPTP
ncbi:MAG: hypothetical protein K8R91_03385 [Phycisphaerae bacterium]|nr:hypothetical protein [Phycisphaerae bacterium]